MLSLSVSLALADETAILDPLDSTAVTSIEISSVSPPHPAPIVISDPVVIKQLLDAIFSSTTHIWKDGAQLRKNARTNDSIFYAISFFHNDSAIYRIHVLDSAYIIQLRAKEGSMFSGYTAANRVLTRSLWRTINDRWPEVVAHHRALLPPGVLKLSGEP